MKHFVTTGFIELFYILEATIIVFKNCLNIPA